MVAVPEAWATWWRAQTLFCLIGFWFSWQWAAWSRGRARRALRKRDSMRAFRVQRDKITGKQKMVPMTEEEVKALMTKGVVGQIPAGNHDERVEEGDRRGEHRAVG